MLTFIPSSEQATKYQSYLWNKKIRKKHACRKLRFIAKFSSRRDMTWCLLSETFTFLLLNQIQTGV